MNRRDLLKAGTMASAGAFLPLAPAIQEAKRILVAGAHPDDPESGCGGTAFNLVQQGHQLDILYFTKGEAGIPGKSHEEAASIREKESREACKILGAAPHFFGQIDGSSFVNTEEYDKMKTMIGDLKPDLVFAQWPVDTHRDHRHLSLLVYGAWLSLDRAFDLYYYEVETGHQTQTFSPTVFSDITESEPIKRKACYAHASQNPDDFYGDHLQMSSFRGLQCGVTHAEAFIHQAGKSFS